MFLKKPIQRPKVTHFSSDDSQNTDYSLDSSIEIDDGVNQGVKSNNFNQLRETMSKLFLSHPELAEEIKFERYIVPDEIDNDPFKNALFHNKFSKMNSNVGEMISQGEEDPTQTMPSAKFWSTISKEMTKPQKNTKMPSVNQINHILNMFKIKIEDKDEAGKSPKKVSSPHKKNRSDFRIQSAKVSVEKEGFKQKEKIKNQLQTTVIQTTNTNVSEEDEEGLNFFSFKKKMQAKLKQKRIQREMEEMAIRKEQEQERDKVNKLREQQQILSTLAELEDEIKKVNQQAKGDTENTEAAKPVKPKQRPQNSRKNSIKPKGDIFERLTKDTMNKVELDEDDDAKKVFLSNFAEALYKDMKAFGDPEAFKKLAQVRIANFKKEFKEKVSKQKQLPTEALKFTKEKSRYLNMFVPDFDRIVPLHSKEHIFINNEVQKDSDEWKENPEIEILSKLQKVRNGNIFDFWRDAKDTNQ